MRLRPDLVLVGLPPRERTQTEAGIVVLPAPSIIVDRVGLVLQVGSQVTDVEPRQRVVFGSDVGEEVTVDDWPCLLLRAQDIDAVID